MFILVGIQYIIPSGLWQSFYFFYHLWYDSISSLIPCKGIYSFHLSFQTYTKTQITFDSDINAVPCNASKLVRLLYVHNHIFNRLIPFVLPLVYRKRFSHTKFIAPKYVRMRWAFFKKFHNMLHHNTSTIIQYQNLVIYICWIFKWINILINDVFIICNWICDAHEFFFGVRVELLFRLRTLLWSRIEYVVGPCHRYCVYCRTFSIWNEIAYILANNKRPGAFRQTNFW